MFSLQLSMYHICGKLRAFLDDFNKEFSYINQADSDCLRPVSDFHIPVFEQPRDCASRQVTWGVQHWESLFLGMACLFIYLLVISALRVTAVKGDVKQNNTYGRLAMFSNSSLIRDDLISFLLAD